MGGYQLHAMIKLQSVDFTDFCYCSVAQSCPTVSDPMDCILPGSSIHGIFPGKSTEVGRQCLLQSVCLLQSLSLGLAM